MSFFPHAVKSVQRGTVTIASTTSGTATISSVDTNYSIVRLLGISGNSTRPIAHLPRVRLTSATQVTAFIADPLGVTLSVEFEVVEFYQFFMNRVVQEGVISMLDGGSTTGTATVTAATGTGELIWLGSNAITVTNGNAAGGVSPRLSISGTTITATRAVTTNDSDTGWAYLDWR